MCSKSSVDTHTHARCYHRLFKKAAPRTRICSMGREEPVSDPLRVRSRPSCSQKDRSIPMELALGCSPAPIRI
jgi:hypothetical protein